jgi:formylglycine-generating enzyme required for sulfatase activity
MGHSNGVFSIAWTNTGTHAVTIERRTSLTSGSWTVIDSNNVTGEHSDSNAPSGVAFYRVVMVSPAPNMVLIPAGEFQMGDSMGDELYQGLSSELPVHTVSISEFYMDKYEVTKALWDEVANWAATNGYDINTASASGKATNHPAHSVRWRDAVKWCNARSEKENLTPCYTIGGEVYRTRGDDAVACNFLVNGYRLPTEAEWEKAARGGLSGKRFQWGETITHSQANYYSTNFYSYDVSPTRGFHPTYMPGSSPSSSPVGSFAPNGYGLHDMAGNMYEWCWDRYSQSYYASSPSSNPQGPSLGNYRVFRGGAWSSSAFTARAAARGAHETSSGGLNDLGFRSVRSSVP